MQPLDLAELARVLEGAASSCESSALVESVSIDSRHMGTRGAFFALDGEQTDGHRFVEDAFANGAVVAVVSRVWADRRSDAEPRPLIAVDSPLRALQRLGGWWRRKLSGRVTAVTGSNGKTIVKDALVHLLSGRYAAAGSLGSYNSQLGVPLATLRIPAEVEQAVLEAGISAPGEMDSLEGILRPDHGILTNIGLAHIASFATRQAIAAEKLKLFRRISETGWVLLPAASDALEPLPADLECRILRWGAPSDELPFFEETVGTREGCRVMLRFPTGLRHQIQTGTPSLEIVSDLEVAICAAWLLGVEPDEIAAASQGWSPSPTRLEIWRAPTQDITIINDSCSSDPVSVQAALRSLANLAEPRGRRLFVFGGMRELGDLSPGEHARVGALAAEYHVDQLVVFGADAATRDTEVAFTTAAESGASVVRCQDADALRHHLDQELRHGDTVLFKGPRSVDVGRAARGLMAQHSPNRLQVDLAAIAENIHVFRRLVGPDCRILGMVKALAYGSDVTRLGLELQKLGVEWLGVATPTEGELLRRAGVDLPILVTLCPPEAAHSVAAHHLTPVIYAPNLIPPLAEAAREHGRKLQVHLKVDTGMGRLGVFPDQVAELARAALDTGWLEVSGLMTHFAAAEDPAQDLYTDRQQELFERVRSELAGMGLQDLLCHAAATAGAVRFPSSRQDMVRIGLGLYGVYPSEAVARELPLTLAVSLVSRITAIREFPKGARLGYGGSFEVRREGFRAAVLPIGYHDAVPWGSSNAGRVLVAGRPAAVVGRVSMDSVLIDVTDIPDAREGSDVLLYGSYDGQTLRPEEVAAQSGTMVYELLARITGLRIHRIFVGA